jgi:hypothetical protein
MERPPSPPQPTRSIASGIGLIILGLLVLLPSGLCTGVLLVDAFSSPDWGSASVPLVIGGPFVFGGGVLIWLGLKRFRMYLEKNDD